MPFKQYEVEFVSGGFTHRSSSLYCSFIVFEKLRPLNNLLILVTLVEESYNRFSFSENVLAEKSRSGLINMGLSKN